MYRVHNLSCNPFTFQFRKCIPLHRMNTHFFDLTFYMFPCSTNISRNFIAKKGSLKVAICCHP